MRNFKASEAEKHRATVMSLLKDVRLHLEVASRLGCRGGIDVRREPHLGSAVAREGQGRWAPARDESSGKSCDDDRLSRGGAMEAWMRMAQALDASDRMEDRRSAVEIAHFVRGTPFLREADRSRQVDGRPPVEVSSQRQERNRGPEISR